MTQFCIQGASTLKKSNEKRMTTSFPESSVYQSKSFAKLQKCNEKTLSLRFEAFVSTSLHGMIFCSSSFRFLFPMSIFINCVLQNVIELSVQNLLGMISAQSLLIIFQFLNKGNIGEANRLPLGIRLCFEIIGGFVGIFSGWLSLFYFFFLDILLLESQSSLNFLNGKICL